MAIIHQILICHCTLCYVSFTASPSVLDNSAGIICGSVAAVVLMVIVIDIITIVIKHNRKKSKVENGSLKDELIEISNLDDRPKDVALDDKPSHPANIYILTVDIMHGHIVKDTLPQIN